MIGSIISTLGPSPMPVGDGLFSFTRFLRHQGLDEDYLGFNTNIRSSKILLNRSNSIGLSCLLGYLNNVIVK